QCRLKGCHAAVGVAVQILLLHLSDQLVQLILVRNLAQGCHCIGQLHCLCIHVGLRCVCVQKQFFRLCQHRLEGHHSFVVDVEVQVKAVRLVHRVLEDGHIRTHFQLVDRCLQVVICLVYVRLQG